uniref:ester cyclase n=1 Tax=Flavobacterium sp. TaxID=239 RepID=UPI0040477D4B
MLPSGGFMGLPSTNERVEMRVVDIYRRDGDKLAENWIFIDLLHFLSMQGLSVLERMEKLLRPNGDITLLP